MREGRYKLTGYLVTRNTLSQGYPFVEAIASWLPLVDELIVYDCQSTDGTFQVLEEIQRNEKVSLFKGDWPNGELSRKLLKSHLVARKLCKGDYIVQIQANEILPERNITFIRALPNAYPEDISFTFPYLQLYRSNILTSEFRVRLAKNLDYIIPIGDAWTLGIGFTYALRRTILSLLNPKKLINVVYNTVAFDYANFADGSHNRVVYLPEPILRYYSFSKGQLVKKLDTHIREGMNTQRAESFEKVKESLNGINDINSQEDNIADLLIMAGKGTHWAQGWPMRHLETKSHPLMMQRILQANEYSIDERLVKKISNGE